MDSDSRTIGGGSGDSILDVGGATARLLESRFNETDAFQSQSAITATTTVASAESLSAELLLAERLFGSSWAQQQQQQDEQHQGQTFGTSAGQPENGSHLLLLFALLVLINLIVILGNILVILAVYATAKLRNVTNIFIVSLATADLMLGVFVLPYALMFEIFDVWVFGKIWCRGWLVTDVWISTASILNLCAISVDRYVAVTRPVKYRSIMTPRRAKTIVAGVWIVSFLICLPPLLSQWNPSVAAGVGREGHSSISSPSLSSRLTSTSLTSISSTRGQYQQQQQQQQQQHWLATQAGVVSRTRRHVGQSVDEESSVRSAQSGQLLLLQPFNSRVRHQRTKADDDSEEIKEKKLLNNSGNRSSKQQATRSAGVATRATGLPPRASEEKKRLHPMHQRTIGATTTTAKRWPAGRLAAATTATTTANAAAKRPNGAALSPRSNCQPLIVLVAGCEDDDDDDDDDDENEEDISNSVKSTNGDAQASESRNSAPNTTDENDDDKSRRRRQSTRQRRASAFRAFVVVGSGSGCTTATAADKAIVSPAAAANSSAGQHHSSGAQINHDDDDDDWPAPSSRTLSGGDDGGLARPARSKRPATLAADANNGNKKEEAGDDNNAAPLPPSEQSAATTTNIEEEKIPEAITVIDNKLCLCHHANAGELANQRAAPGRGGREYISIVAAPPGDVIAGSGSSAAVDPPPPPCASFAFDLFEGGAAALNGREEDVVCVHAVAAAAAAAVAAAIGGEPLAPPIGVKVGDEGSEQWAQRRRHRSHRRQFVVGGGGGGNALAEATRASEQISLKMDARWKRATRQQRRRLDDEQQKPGPSSEQEQRGQGSQVESAAGRMATFKRAKFIVLNSAGEQQRQQQQQQQQQQDRQQQRQQQQRRNDNNGAELRQPPPSPSLLLLPATSRQAIKGSRRPRSQFERRRRRQSLMKSSSSFPFRPARSWWWRKRQRRALPTNEPVVVAAAAGNGIVGFGGGDGKGDANHQLHGDVRGIESGSLAPLPPPLPSLRTPTDGRYKLSSGSSKFELKLAPAPAARHHHQQSRAFLPAAAAAVGRLEGGAPPETIELLIGRPSCIATTANAATAAAANAAAAGQGLASDGLFMLPSTSSSSPAAAAAKQLAAFAVDRRIDRRQRQSHALPTAATHTSGNTLPTTDDGRRQAAAVAAAKAGTAPATEQAIVAPPSSFEPPTTTPNTRSIGLVGQAAPRPLERITGVGSERGAISVEPTLSPSGQRPHEQQRPSETLANESGASQANGEPQRPQRATPRRLSGCTTGTVAAAAAKVNVSSIVIIDQAAYLQITGSASRSGDGGSRSSPLLGEPLPFRLFLPEAGSQRQSAAASGAKGGRLPLARAGLDGSCCVRFVALQLCSMTMSSARNISLVLATATTSRQPKWTPKSTPIVVVISGARPRRAAAAVAATMIGGDRDIDYHVYDYYNYYYATETSASATGGHAKQRTRRHKPLNSNRLCAISFSSASFSSRPATAAAATTATNPDETNDGHAREPAPGGRSSLKSLLASVHCGLGPSATAAAAAGPSNAVAAGPSSARDKSQGAKRQTTDWSLREDEEEQEERPVVVVRSRRRRRRQRRETTSSDSGSLSLRAGRVATAAAAPAIPEVGGDLLEHTEAEPGHRRPVEGGAASAAGAISSEEGGRKKLGCALFDDKPYVIYSALGSFYIPMLVMVFFYSRIYLVASRAQKAMQRGYMTTKWPGSGTGGHSPGNKGGRGGANGGGIGGGYGDGAGERVTLRIHRREKNPPTVVAADEDSTSVAAIGPPGADNAATAGEDSGTTAAARGAHQNQQRSSAGSTQSSQQRDQLTKSSVLVKLSAIEQQHALAGGHHRGHFQNSGGRPAKLQGPPLTIAQDSTSSQDAAAAGADGGEVMLNDAHRTMATQASSASVAAVNETVRREPFDDSKNNDRGEELPTQRLQNQPAITNSDDNLAAAVGKSQHLDQAASRAVADLIHQGREHESAPPMIEPAPKCGWPGEGAAVSGHNREEAPKAIGAVGAINGPQGRQDAAIDCACEAADDDSRAAVARLQQESASMSRAATQHHRHRHHHHHHRSHHSDRTGTTTTTTTTTNNNDLPQQHRQHRHHHHSHKHHHHHHHHHHHQHKRRHEHQPHQSPPPNCRTLFKSTAANGGGRSPVDGRVVASGGAPDEGLMHSSIAEETCRGPLAVDDVGGSTTPDYRVQAPSGNADCSHLAARNHSDDSSINSVQITVSQYDDEDAPAIVTNNNRAASRPLDFEVQDGSAIFVAVTPPPVSSSSSGGAAYADHRGGPVLLDMSTGGGGGGKCERSKSVDVSSPVRKPVECLVLSAVGAHWTAGDGETGEDDSPLQSRVDRSHSSAPTPTILVNWNPAGLGIMAKQTGQLNCDKRVLVSEQMLTTATTTTNTAATRYQTSTDKIDSPPKDKDMRGSQGSGLSIMANIPMAASQVRKQSIMLLSTISTRSSQTLRRLSMAALHPVDSLLKRSRSRDGDQSSSSSDDDADKDYETNSSNAGGNKRLREAPDSEKRKRRRRRRRRKRAKSRSPSSASAPKRTFDDYLMAVAGIDSSSTDFSVDGDDDNDDCDDDDDDDDDDERESIDYASMLLNRKRSIAASAIAATADNKSPNSNANVVGGVGTDSRMTVATGGICKSNNETTKAPDAIDETTALRQLSSNEEEEEEKAAVAVPLRPGLHRQGAYYERATSRASNKEDGMDALKMAANGEKTAALSGRRVMIGVNNLDGRQSGLGVVGGGGGAGAAKGARGPPRRRGAKRTSRWHAKRLHAETKAAKTVAIIVGGFIFCWLPFFTAYLSRAIICERPDCIPQSLLSLFIWLGYLNSAINPVIYGLFSADFRHAFKNILCRCRFRSTDDTVVVSVLVDSIIKSIL